MLSAEHINLTLNGVPLLQDVSLELAPGSVTAIMGANGAGKTSLLKALTGELPVSSGNVRFNQHEVSHWSASERATMMAVLAQNSALNFPYTVEEVVALGRTPHSTGAARDKEIVNAALKLVDCKYLQRRIYTQLSGGEKQRVQFARVLAQIWDDASTGDRLLVLDEPTASFDLAHQRMMVETISHLTSQNVAVLIVLHDLNLAINCADKIVMLGCGRIQAMGSPQEVMTPAIIKDVFDVAVDILPHPTTGEPVVIPL